MLGRPEPLLQTAAFTVEDSPGAAGGSRLSQPVIRCQAPAPGAPAPGAPVPVVPPPGSGVSSPEDPLTCGVVTNPAPTSQPLVGGGGQGFFQRCQGALGQVTNPCGGRRPFQSDHQFDTFISPVTHPFYFEDPRSLTEVRPIFMYERTPGSTPIFAGGNIEWLGLQARLALTERLSFVLSELGYIWVHPHAPTAAVPGGSGFSELHLGPQYTFIRNDCTGTLFAGGLQFEIPTGSASTAQDTGTLSVTPYFSFGQAFGETKVGRFHFLNTTGYSFAVDRERTDRFFSSFHLDFDVGNCHKFYPLIELNWIVYPVSGDARPVPFEGADLINFGSTEIAGKNELTLAFGARYKFCEAIQLGAAFEFPLLTNKELEQWRLTVDVIFRY
jgi:hypothetical protein